MAPAGTNVSAALALASNSEIVVASNPMKNTRMMLFRRDQTASIVRQQSRIPTILRAEINPFAMQMFALTPF
jgi:hypothetical protein